jgi:hypothetical protein
MAEGIADLGVSVAQDPRWFDHRCRGPSSPRARSIHCGTPDMLDALPVDDSAAPYDPYPLGSVIASGSGTRGSSTTNQNTAKGVLAALPALQAAPGASAATSPTRWPTVRPTSSAAICAAISLNRFFTRSRSGAQLPSCAGQGGRHSECTQ